MGFCNFSPLMYSHAGLVSGSSRNCYNVSLAEIIVVVTIVFPPVIFSLQIPLFAVIAISSIIPLMALNHHLRIFYLDRCDRDVLGLSFSAHILCRRSHLRHHHHDFWSVVGKQSGLDIHLQMKPSQSQSIPQGFYLCLNQS